MSASSSNAEWLNLIRQCVSDGLGVAEEDVEEDVPFAQIGLTSAGALVLRDIVLKELHVTPDRLPLTLAFDFPTLRKLTTFLQDAQGQPASSTEPVWQTGAVESLFRHVGVQCITASLADGSHHQQFLQTAVIGCDAAVETPLARWDVNSHCQINDTVSVTRHGSFLTEIDLFDAAHFEISFAEAAVIDPGQRLVLQCAGEVLPQTDARDRSASCAVVVAQFHNDWSLLMGSCSGTSPSSHASAAVCACIAANRVSFSFDLHGPSFAVDTACSSALVAVSLAAQLARAGASPALAAAVNLLLHPAVFRYHSSSGLLSCSGRCRSFDASADGYGRAEAVGALYLGSGGPKLEAAAVVSSGRGASLTAPSSRAQQELLHEALEQARRLPNDLVMLESHGTGTVLGDVAEMTSAGRGRSTLLWLGAGKTCLGHSEGAAGLAGLARLLAGLHELLAQSMPLAHLCQVSTSTSLALATEVVSASACPLDAKAYRCGVGGVSSFGFGGTLAHALLSFGATAAAQPAPPAFRKALFRWSAHRHPFLETLRHVSTSVCYRVRVTEPRILALLNDHVIFGEIVVPAAAFLEFFVAGLAAQREGASVALGGLGFFAPMVLAPDSEEVAMELSIDGDGSLEISSHVWPRSQAVGSKSMCWSFVMGQEPRVLRHCEAWVQAVPSPRHECADPAEVRRWQTVEESLCLDADKFYAQAHAAGYTLGASFRTVRRLGSSASNLVGVLRAEEDGFHHHFWLHPGVVDGAIQLAGLAPNGFYEQQESPEIKVPVSARSAHLALPFPRPGPGRWPQWHAPGCDWVVIMQVLASSQAEVMTSFTVSEKVCAESPVGPDLPLAVEALRERPLSPANARAARARKRSSPVEHLYEVVWRSLQTQEVASDSSVIADKAVTHSLGELSIGPPSDRLVLDLREEDQLDSAPSRLAQLAAILAARATEPTTRSLFVTSATSRGVWGLDALLRCCSAEGMASPLLLQAPRGYDTRLWQWTGAAEDEEELRVGEDDKLCVRRLQRFSGEPMPVRWDCDGGTFVVSGGLGGIGLCCAAWLAPHASALVLFGRTARPEASRRLVQMTTGSCEISVRYGDLVQRSSVAGLRDLLAGQERRGVFHFAGVLAESTFSNLGLEHFQAAFAGKVFGAQNLWEECGAALRRSDVFLTASSVVALLGGPGQGAYAAANAALERLTEAWGASQALAIQWGPWAEVGMAAATETLERQQAYGWQPLPPHLAMQLLSACLSLQTPGPVVAAAAVNWARYLRQLPKVPSALVEFESSPRPASPAPGKAEVEALLRAALLDLRVTLPCADAPLMEQGLDSLAAVELRNRLSRALCMPGLPATMVFDYPTASSLASFLKSRMDPAAAGPGAVPEVLPAAAPARPTRSPGIGQSVLRAASCIQVRGQDAVHQVPIERWDMSAYFGEDPSRSYSRHGSFIDGLELFDADHFGLSASEAAGMGPAQRQVLEVAAEALHLPPQGGPDIAVVVGSTQHDWMLLQEPAAYTSVYGGLAINGAVLANRISYNFALRGPSFVVDTACSTALVAVDAACRYLPDVASALVVAANLLIAPQVFVLYSLAQMLSRAGRCFTFNATAEGYVRGEGIAALQLSADEARHAEGHLLGSAVNSDGRSASFTAPSGRAQEEMLLAALAACSRSAAPSIVECHGTGTALGDPIEVGALHRVFRLRAGPVLLSSSKTGLGHGEALAGVASLLRLFAPCAAPSNHLQVMNTHFDPRCADSSGCLVFASEAVAARRERGASSFGFGGTNAHVIVRTGASAPPARRLQLRSLPFPWKAAPAVLDGKLFDVQWTEWRAVEEKPPPLKDSDRLIVALLPPDLKDVRLLSSDIRRRSPVESAEEDFGSLPANLAAEVKSRSSSLVLFLRRSGTDAGLLAEEIFELLALSAGLCRSRARAELVVVSQRCALAGIPGEGSPAAAALWGLARSLRLEAPWVRVRLLDTDGPEDLEQLLPLLLNQEAELECAYRRCNAHVVVPRLRPLPAFDGTPPWPPLRGWHLVSGGTGGIGLLAAQALARQAEGLVLLSRRGVIAKQEHALFEELEGRLQRKLQRVRADVSNLEAMEAVMQQLPELAGVVHAAQAPLGYRDLAGQSRATFLGEYSVRALGAWVLHRTTLTRHSLRSFVGITSLNALLGQGSNAAIATANLVVDGLLAQRRAQGLPGLSLQFSRVADVGSNAKQPLRYASAVSAIRELSFQNCAAFLRAMLVATGPPRVPVLLADVDWRAFQDQIGLQLPALRDLGRGVEWGAGCHQDAHNYQSLAAPVAVVGAGFGGLSAARELQRRGIDFRIFEKQGALGGSWRSMANRTSKAQIERGTYHLGLADGECTAKLPNYTPRDAMLDHAQEFASHHRILDHCRFRAEVVQVDMEAPGTYNVGWQSPDGLRHHEGPFAAVMVYPGFLPKPRDEPLPEERRFQGRIALGVADDLLDWGDWRHVLILGHGAFAVESTRTAAEAGAASVTMLCRRRNLVLPRVAAWLVDGSGPGAELGMDALLHISQPMYELVGLSAQQKEQALRRSILADPRGKVMSQSNPAISDVYFLLQALGVLEVVVGQLAELLPRSARLSLEGGGRSRTVDCSMVVKCLGWDHSAQDALNRGLQVQSLRGFWINGDPRRFVFKFASRTDGARSLATLSFFVQLQNAHDAFFHFLQRPGELEDTIGGLPTSPSLAEDLGSTFVGQTLLALGRGVPGLAVSQRNVARMKAARMQRVHPADRFLEELQEEWKQYQQRLRPGLPALQYPYSLLEVEHMLAESQQRSAAYEAARPADQPLAKARDRQTLKVEISQQALETAILSATAAALGTATELSADTPLLDLGLDSLAQIDLRQALAKRLGDPASRLLSASLLFDYPTARSMATLLMGQLDAEREPEDVNATAAAATTQLSTQATTGEPKSESPADSSGQYQPKQRALPEAIVPRADPARVLVPTSWSDGRPCRLLFLHGARCDAATTRSFLEATAWSTLKRREGAKVPLFEIGLVDAPHADVADPKLFESAVRAGWYDPEGVYRQWRLPNEAGDTGQWAESLSLISHVWRQWGPFDGVAGLCEGASAAALALLSGAMQPPPRLLISIGGYAAPAQLCSDLYRQTAGVPSFHFVGIEEESPAQAFPGLPCWDGAFKERMDIDGSHRLPELHGPAAAALRRFVALAQGEADHADGREQRAELDPPEATFMDQRRLQSEILQAIARVRPASRTHLQAAASRLESRTQTADDEELLTSHLAELGVASLEWMLLRQSLLHLLPGIPIPPELLFDAPTVAELSQQLQRLRTPVASEAILAGVASQSPEVTSLPQNPLMRPAGEAAPAEDGRTSATVHPTAVLRGDVDLGEGCVVGEHAIVGPRVRLGARCRIAAMAIVEEDVTLEEDCEVGSRGLLRGPLVAGKRNRFDEGCCIGCHSRLSGALPNGHVSIGDDCLFEIGSVVLAPRGLNGKPGVTRIGNGVMVQLKGEVSHDCVLEDGVFLNGELAGYCHLMANAKVAKGAVLHQFTTVGTSSFCTMMTKVRHDVLPFCVMDDVLLVDRVALSRQGKSEKEAEELDQFYSRQFSSEAAPYVRSLDGILPEDTEGPWFSSELRRFFQIRSQMRDRRPLARYGAAVASQLRKDEPT